MRCRAAPGLTLAKGVSPAKSSRTPRLRQITELTTAGTLSAANFGVGTAAADANDFIVYNNSTGALYYDADGSGAGAAIHFATVYASGAVPAALDAAEFMVI